MDATLRYAQQAEAEAEAPRLTVPFYSFVEKGLEGAPMEEQQMAFAWGAMLMLDYLSLGTMGLATGPLRAIEPGVEALAARSGGRASELLQRSTKMSVSKGKMPNHLYWHGEADAVVRRKAGGIFVDGPGNNKMFWSTSKLRDELGPFAWKIGGTDNVKLFPPRLVPKGAIEATYELTPAERAMFRRAWGFDFNWNPLMWWKGAFGQHYLRPVAASWAQRLGEVGYGVGAGTIVVAPGGYYVYKKLRE